MVDEIVAAGGTVLAAVADVSSWDDAHDLVERPLATWGRLDILVNCAGNFVRDTIGEVTPESLARVRRVHLDGMVNTSHFAALHWIERGEYGRLINFTSDAAMVGRRRHALVRGREGRRDRADALRREGACELQRDRERPHAGVPHEDARRVPRPRGRADASRRATPAAGYVTGRVFGSYGYRYARWSEPAHEAVLESDGPWDLDRLFERFPATLGAGLTSG